MKITTYYRHPRYNSNRMNTVLEKFILFWNSSAFIKSLLLYVGIKNHWISILGWKVTNISIVYGSSVSSLIKLVKRTNCSTGKFERLSYLIYCVMHILGFKLINPLFIESYSSGFQYNTTQWKTDCYYRHIVFISTTIQMYSIIFPYVWHSMEYTFCLFQD